MIIALIEFRDSCHNKGDFGDRQIMIPTNQNPAPLLSVRNLTLQIDHGPGSYFPVKEVSFDVGAGKTLALIGESGSGKTLTALALIGLLPKNVKRVDGEIWFENREISSIGASYFRELRGKEIAMIFQEPVSSLNPVFRVGTQITDVIKTHLKTSSSHAKQKTIELFQHVGLEDPAWVFRAYPHELSGGMAQRVMIAMALSCGPKLIIADEPTTALDVITQIQILDLIRDLQQEHEFGLLFISHDMNVVSAMADSITVMSEGRVVARGKTQEILDSTHNPVRAFIGEDCVQPGN